jgi:hypothetical protein
MVEPDKAHMTIRRMRVACWISKATKIRSEYLILIAFTRQQWLRARAAVSRYTYTACFILFLGCFQIQSKNGG